MDEERTLKHMITMQIQRDITLSVESQSTHVRVSVRQIAKVGTKRARERMIIKHAGGSYDTKASAHRGLGDIMFKQLEPVIDAMMSEVRCAARESQGMSALCMPRDAFTSPLQYPGGKTRVVSLLHKYVEEHYPARNTVVSPFLGGGSFELFMAKRGYHVFANDVFEPLVGFWHALASDEAGLAERATALLTHIDGGPAFRALQQQRPVSPEAYFVLNRCSFGGLTLSGGYSTRKRRLTAVHGNIARVLHQPHSKLMHVSNMDCIAFMETHPEQPGALIFADPPYLLDTQGACLYGYRGSEHANFDHSGFATYMMGRRDWLITYNDCQSVRALYPGCRFFREKIRYSMSKQHGDELFILPPSSA